MGLVRFATVLREKTHARSAAARRADPEIVDWRGRPLPRPLVAARSREPPQPLRRRGLGGFRARLRRAFLRHRFTYSRLFRRWHAARRCGTAAYGSTHDARGRGSILDREAMAEPR